MSCEELTCLYQQLSPGELPCGFYTGRAIYKAGSPITVPYAGATRLIWQGKFIYPEQGLMLNKVLGGKGVPAELSSGVSWMDGNPSTIMDYAPFGKWSARARDEIREVRPGLYLGCMYLRDKCGCGRRFSMFFALEKRCTSCP